jgi:hypothetical protein
MNIDLRVSRVNPDGTYEMSINTELVSSDVVVKVLKDAAKGLEGTRLVRSDVRTYGDPNDGPI